MDIEIREPRTQHDFELYYDLRWRTLRKPWGQSRESAKDSHELESIHLMAWTEEKLVGVGRIHFISTDEGQIRFMAVEQGYSGRGVGGCILERLEQRGMKAGMNRIILNARTDAIPFYRKHGYRLVEESDRLFNSITQWRMIKCLT